MAELHITCPEDTVLNSLHIGNLKSYLDMMSDILETPPGTLRKIATDAVSRIETQNPHLTPRDEKILEFLADGATDIEICKKTKLTIRTVREYVSRVLKKLNLKDRSQVTREVWANLAQRKA
jgi:DNA-binding NarL/FixJ family response regulator